MGGMPNSNFNPRPGHGCPADLFAGASLSQPLPRGAVVHHAEQTLIIWSHRPTGIALGLPISPQIGPRHRSHVPLSPSDCTALGLRPRASIIETGQPMIGVDQPPQLVGQCSPDLLARIAVTIRRARESVAIETMLAAPTSRRDWHSPNAMWNVWAAG